MLGCNTLIYYKNSIAELQNDLHIKRKRKKKKFCATMRKMLFGAKVATGISLMRYNGFVNITFYVLTIEVRKVP